MAADSLYPEFEDLQLVGRVSATPEQLLAATRVPEITPRSMIAAGIVPPQPERRPDWRTAKFRTLRLDQWAEGA
jgi:hypothetical protein